MNADVILKIEELAVKIAGSQVLSGISCSVVRASVLGIIGPNGSGKTTLFNCLSGFHRIESGAIYFERQPIHQLAPHERTNIGIARIFQNFGIFREMSVLDNMLVAMERKLNKLELLLPSSTKSRAIRKEALHFLEKVDLADKAKHKAASLSGGQMRLLEISRALASGASLFLLDEPTAGVSPKLKERVAELIVELNSLGKTVMIIEHDINFIESFCSRILVLNDGQIVMDDVPVAIRNSALIQEIYFGRQQL